MYAALGLSIIWQFLCLILVALLPFTPAFAAEPAGRVLFAVGTPTATTSDGSMRVLRKGDAIEEGNLLVTGEGRLQLVFKDNAIVALHPGSRFQVERYRYAVKGDDSDGVVLRLLQGGLRTISGLVGKRNRSDYRMESMVATIGIRGTEYSLELTDRLIGSVNEGAIEVCNGAGCLQVGAGHAFLVPSLTEPPVPGERRVFLPPPPAQHASAITNDEQSAPNNKETDVGEREQGSIVGTREGADLELKRPGNRDRKQEVGVKFLQDNNSDHKEGKGSKKDLKPLESLQTLGQGRTTPGGALAPTYGLNAALQVPASPATSLLMPAAPTPSISGQGAASLPLPSIPGMVSSPSAGVVATPARSTTLTLSLPPPSSPSPVAGSAGTPLALPWPTSVSAVGSDASGLPYRLLTDDGFNLPSVLLKKPRD